VRLVILVYRKRTQDPTNVRASLKELEDALVKRGWAVDDDEKWLDLRCAEEASKDERTVIEWEML
jgi:hypothetical protein